MTSENGPKTYTGSNWITLDGIPDSGVARWTFDSDDTNSGTAVDVWGSYDGSINGATTGVSGANQTYNTNEAYSFDLTDDIVDIGNPSGITASDFGSSISCACWFKPDNLKTDKTRQRLFAHGASDGNDDLALYLNGNIPDSLQGFIGTTNNNVSTSISFSNIDESAWGFAALSYDSSQVKLYYYNNSGTLYTDSTSQSGDLTGADRGWAIGARLGTDEHFGGDIDDPRLYNKGLTDIEVSNLYNNGSI